MFNFNIFLSVKKKSKRVKENKKDKEIEQYKFIRRMMYIKRKYPNCPNSDYVRLMEVKKITEK